MKENGLSIPLPSLFSFEECLWFLNRNYDDCLHSIRNNEIIKAIHIKDQPLLVSIRREEQNLHVNLLQGKFSPAVRVALTQYITEWFDMDRNIEPFYTLLQKEKQLRYMKELFSGLRLIGITDLFEALCWSITGQQINLTFAYKLKRRLTEHYGTALSFEGNKYYIFPRPEALATADIMELRSMQFSESKASYIINTAKAFVNGELSKEKITLLPDFEARQKTLIHFKGIGVWTANYVLMKTMKESSSIPYGDVGLLNALAAHSIIKDRKELQKAEQLFKRFKGWESYLVFYLWRSLSTR